MDLGSISEYVEDVKYVANLNIPWESLKNGSIMISGASGLIGSFLVDVIQYKNNYEDYNCRIYAMGRSKEKMSIRFSKHLDNCNFNILECNVVEGLQVPFPDHVDYVIHLASNTHPLLYSTDPVGTILTNVIGLNNLLEFAVLKHVKRFAFASSNEMYGENRGDVELFDEEYCGYINCNTLRAGYPESKRCGESLCQAYIKKYNIDVVIPRFTRTYGPTMNMGDTKAISQFIRNAIYGEDVVLKSSGTQYYSYCYVADAVAGLLTVLLAGENGHAYNISDICGDITLKDLANLIANISGRKVIHEYPDKLEAAGYSAATKARLDGGKLRRLGWRPKYDIFKGVERTISIMKSM